MQGKKGDNPEAEGFKIDGWIRWLAGLRGNYERRMRVMCEALEEGKFIVSDAPSPKVRSAPSELSIRSVRGGRTNRVDPNTPTCSHSRTTKNVTTPANSDNDDFESDAFTNLHKTQIYNFNPPMAGMFAWVHYHFDTHPVAGGSISMPQLAHAFWILQTKEPYLILTAPGAIFAPSDKIRDEKAWQYFRLCFAAIDEKDVKSQSERFVRASHDFWELKEEDIQKLLDEDEADGVNERVRSIMEEGKWTVSPLMC